MHSCCGVPVTNLVNRGRSKGRATNGELASLLAIDTQTTEDSPQQLRFEWGHRRCGWVAPGFGTSSAGGLETYEQEALWKGTR